MDRSRRRSVIVAYALLAGVPFAITLGLGLLWVYLSILPVIVLAAILFLVTLGHRDAKRQRKDRRFGFANPLAGVPFVSSLAGMGVALARAF